MIQCNDCGGDLIIVVEGGGEGGDPSIGFRMKFPPLALLVAGPPLDCPLLPLNKEPVEVCLFVSDSGVREPRRNTRLEWRSKKKKKVDQ